MKNWMPCQFWNCSTTKERNGNMPTSHHVHSFSKEIFKLIIIFETYCSTHIQCIYSKGVVKSEFCNSYNETVTRITTWEWEFYNKAKACENTSIYVYKHRAMRKYHKGRDIHVAPTCVVEYDLRKRMYEHLNNVLRCKWLNQWTKMENKTIIIIIVIIITFEKGISHINAVIPSSKDY